MTNNRGMLDDGHLYVLVREALVRHKFRFKSEEQRGRFIEVAIEAARMLSEQVEKDIQKSYYLSRRLSPGAMAERVKAGVADALANIVLFRRAFEQVLDEKSTMPPGAGFGVGEDDLSRRPA